MSGPMNTKEQFITKSKVLHGNTYDYTKFEYKGYRTRSIIICPVHGEFEQTPNNHIQSKIPCKKCSLLNRGKKAINILNNINIKFNNKFSFNKEYFIGSKSKMRFNCPLHGEFHKSPNRVYFSKHGCPQCGKDAGYKVNSIDTYKGRKTILYYIKIFSAVGIRYKIGLTLNNVHLRYKYDKIKYDILLEEIFENGECALEKEQKIIKNNKKYRINENILIGGNTEIFYKDVLKGEY